MAMSPYMAPMSSRSSSTFTTKTVLAKLATKPSSAAVRRSRLANGPTPSAPSPSASPPKNAVLMVICTRVVTQT